MENLQPVLFRSTKDTLCINGRMLRRIYTGATLLYKKGISNCTVNFQDLLNDCFHEIQKAIDMK
jgi:hypothetical protein